MKKILAIVMIVMIIVLGISIERDISVVNTVNLYEKYINYNMLAKPKNLQLTDELNTREQDLLLNLFQGLVKEDENGEIVGGLAQDITVSENGLQYNFKLRSDIYYNTGEKIQSKDFVEFFKSFLNDKNNLYRGDLDFIYGVKDYREGKVDFSQVAIFEDEDMVTIRLNNPCPYFLEILAHPVYALRDYEKVKEYNSTFKGIRYSGPFVIKEISGEDLILSKNIKYYNKDKVTDEEIRIAFIDSTEDALAIFEDNSNKLDNKVDLMLDVPVNEVYRLHKQGLIKEFPGKGILQLNFNGSDDNPASTFEFRAAVKNSIDREGCAAEVSETLIEPIYSYLDDKEETLEVFKPQLQDNMKTYFENLVKDSELKIKVIYEDNSLQRRIAKELSEELSRVTNIEFIPTGYSGEELQKVLIAGDYHIYINIFQSNYNSEFEYFKSASSNEGNEAVNAGISKALYTLDKAERAREFVQCEEILAKSMSQIPLYHINNTACFKSDLDGFYVNTYGNMILEEIKRVR